MAWLRTLLIWVAFLGCLFGGAGLMLSNSPVLFATGLALLLAPAAFLVYLTLAHYYRQRRDAQP